MVTVAVVFHSATGATKGLANSIARGVLLLPGARVVVIEIVGSDINNGRYRNQENLDALDQVDAIIFGSPTFMGNVSAEFKAFADATSDKWADQTWSNKIAGGFTIGSNFSGDQLMTIQYLQIFSNQHGMLWASLDIPGGCDPQGRNRLGAQSGLIAQSADAALNETDLVTAKYLGQRVTKLAIKYAENAK